MVQNRSDWYAAGHPNTPLIRGGGEDAVNKARCTVRLKRCQVRIKIHTLGLALLLINVGNPNQWRTPSGQCGKDLRNEKVRDHTCVERSWTEHDEVSLLNRGQRRWRGARIFRGDADAVDVARARELGLTPHGRTANRCSDQLQGNRGSWDHLATNIQNAMHARNPTLKIATLLMDRRGEQEVADGVTAWCARLSGEPESQEIRRRRL